MSEQRTADVVVVGAGAAGLMAAIHAAERGARALLLERTSDGGRKILISGGGRCNVLPSRAQPERFVTSSSVNAMKRLLRAWPLEEQRRFFEDRLGLPLALEPETGKLFPVSNRARDVRDRLVEHARELGARIRFETRVTDLRANGAGWQVLLDDGGSIEAGAVVLATGGLSVPQTGSDGTGLSIARRLGHTIHETYPALTPLTADPAVHAPLAGVSLTVTIDAPLPRGRFSTTGGFLFTHRGWSGPAVLDASHHAVRARLRGEPQTLLVRWTTLGSEEWDRALRDGGRGATVGSVVRRALPARLADALIDETRVDAARPLAELRREERARLVGALASYPLPWTGDEGYRKAEVTGGGVALAEIDLKTMESRVCPRLHLCGEMLDAFGPIGGHNFMWAWSTGRQAGLGAAGAA